MLKISDGKITLKEPSFLIDTEQAQNEKLESRDQCSRCKRIFHAGTTNWHICKFLLPRRFSKTFFRFNANEEDVILRGTLGERMSKFYTNCLVNPHPNQKIFRTEGYEFYRIIEHFPKSLDQIKISVKIKGHSPSRFSVISIFQRDDESASSSEIFCSEGEFEFERVFHIQPINLDETWFSFRIGAIDAYITLQHYEIKIID